MNGEFVYCSNSVKDLIGYDPEFLIHKIIYEFMHPDDFKKMIKMHLKYSVNMKKPSINENPIFFRIKTKNDTWKWIKVKIHNAYHGNLVIQVNSISFINLLYVESISIFENLKEFFKMRLMMMAF